MTKSTDAIVTELGNGPSSARELSQRIEGIGYAAIRQALSRLAKAGIVTKPARGVYALDCDTVHCDKASAPIVTGHCDIRLSPDQAHAVEEVLTAYLALDDPNNPEAWA